MEVIPVAYKLIYILLNEITIDKVWYKDINN